MRVTSAELVAEVRYRDRGAILDPVDRERFLAANPISVKVRDWSGERRQWFLRYVVRYLLRLGSARRATETLTSFDFMAIRVSEQQLGEVLLDLDETIAAAGEPEALALRQIRRALELSRPLLERDPEQLPEQLIARLPAAGASADLARLLRGARTCKRQPWLRPLAERLMATDSALLRTLEGPVGAIDGVAVCPDSRTCLVAAASALMLWDMLTGVCLLTLPLAVGDTTSLLVTADRRYAILAQRDPDIQIWDLDQRSLRHRLGGHTGAVLALALTPAGRLFSGSTDGTIRVWDPENGRPHGVIETGDTVQALAVLPDGRVLAGGGDPSARRDHHALTLWNVGTGERRSFAPNDWPIDAVAVTDDGQEAVVAANRALQVWDLGRLALRHTLHGHDGKVHALATVPGQRMAISAGGDDNVILWSLATGQRIRTLGAHQADVMDVAVSRDGRLAVSGSMDQTLRVWDLRAASEPQPGFGHTQGVNAILVTPEDRVVSASNDHTILVWDLATAAPPEVLLGHTHWVRALAQAPRGGPLLSASWDGTVRQWDLATGESITLPLGEGEHLTALAIAADASRAVAGTYRGRLVVWDLDRAGTPPIAFAAHAKSVSSLAVLATRRQALSCSDDGTLKIWDLDRRQQIAVLDPGAPRPAPSGDEARDLLDPRRLPGPCWNALRLLPGERRALAGSSDGTLVLWNLETGALERRWGTAPAGIANVAVSPDGRLAAAVSGLPTYASDNTLRLWNLETRQQVARFTGDAPFLSCAVSSDGRTFIAGDHRGKVHFLRLENPEP